MARWWRPDWAELPFVSLPLGFLGDRAAIVAVSALLSGRDRVASDPLSAGAHSLIIYLAFVLPMAATRVILIKSGLIADAGTMSALVTIVAVIVPLALYWLVRDTRLRFLFERPDAFRLKPPLATCPATLTASQVPHQRRG